MEPRPEPRVDWFVTNDGDGAHIGTWRAEILSGFPHVEECRRVASEILPGRRAAIEKEGAA